MNTKVILILFILLLNVAMIILINKKGTKDPLDGFFNESSCDIDCSGIEAGNTDFCNAIASCRKKQTSDTSLACENRCRFNPLNRKTEHQTGLTYPDGTSQNDSYNKNNSNSNRPNDDGNANCSKHDKSETNCETDSNCYKVMSGDNFEKCVSKSGREENGKFPSEEEKGAYSACNEYCTSNWAGDKKHVGSDVSFYTDCKSSDCLERCTDYLLNKSNTDLTSYGPYPTNRIGETDFNHLKTQFINQLTTDNTFKGAIKSQLYQQEIEAVSDDMDDIETKNQRLGEIMSTLKRLNGTGNNFLQQVDQLGEFQSKYSDRIDDILNSRRSDSNNNFDTKIQNLSLKINKLNDIYNSFNDQYNIPNLDQAVLEPYKQISTTTGSGEVILNLTPVRYLVTTTTDGTTTNNEYYLKRQGAYLINSNNINDYLHYSKYMGPEGNRDIRVIPATGIPEGEEDTYLPISFKLNYTRTSDTGYTPPAIFRDYFVANNENDDNKLDVLTDDNRTDWSNLPKKDFYFYISRINNIQEYNAMLLKTQGESSLISTNSNIKFPFYIIESAKRPGYLLKVRDSSTGSKMILYMDKANNSPEEKFTNVGITAANLGSCSTST